MKTAPLTAESAVGEVVAEAPHLFLVLERARPLAGGARHSLANIDRVKVGRGATRDARRVVEDGVRTLLLAVPDGRMSTLHAVLEQKNGAWTFADSGSTNGSRVGGARTDRTALADGDLLELAGTFFRFRSALRSSASAPGDVDSSTLSGFIASVGTVLPGLASDLETLARVARSNVAVLLRGESGTGKEVLARAIHTESGRRGDFVAVNCGALPAGLVESLLFGHRKGAFSGATVDAPGFVRAAHGGTLFLDEIGDLPSASQAALLRVLQEREVIPVGETRPVTVDLRIVAATHKPLEALVESGSFRNDLLARLAGFRFALAPLRERMDDLGVLVAALLRKLQGDAAGSLSFGADAAQALLAYDWPRNIRELEQCLAVSVLLAQNGRLERVQLSDAEEPRRGAGPVESKGASTRTPEEEALRKELVARLAEHDGNVTRVGEAMGKARTQVQRWIKRLKIDPGEFRR